MTLVIFLALLSGFVFACLMGVLLYFARKTFGTASRTRRSFLRQTAHLSSGQENLPKPNVLNEVYQFGPLSTLSPKVCEILKAAQIIASTSSTLLIEGESGTGKEWLARAIHENGPRDKHPFVAVNAAALPENLLESELFGHEKGAFTGAIQQRKGRFELADGGTLFLDEIGELSPLLQVKLLRVLQERVFERVGSEKPLRIDVRIIAATNQNLSEMVKRGHFREDLFYRLNVVCLRLVPLRARKEDLALLAGEFLSRHQERLDKKVSGYTDDFLIKLASYSFPGNIRELENLMERALIFCKDSKLSANHLFLPEETHRPLSPVSQDLSRDLSIFEKRINYKQIMEAYYKASGNKAQAARQVNMRESTYRYHLKKAMEGTVSQGTVSQGTVSQKQKEGGRL